MKTDISLVFLLKGQQNYFKFCISNTSLNLKHQALVVALLNLWYEKLKNKIKQ